MEAFEKATERTSTMHAPWCVIPENYKSFRNLAISQTVADTPTELDLRLPPTPVGIAAIRRECDAREAARARISKGKGQKPA
ncbi:MAG TPA: polyphosphate kinase 2, partial [Deltaproteobacteria bacterium]|nr:polyphosphate kinase 2 [Deltaproteobacteria bacterium]